MMKGTGAASIASVSWREENSSINETNGFSLKSLSERKRLPGSPFASRKLPLLREGIERRLIKC
jgi:hypothetical protein